MRLYRYVLINTFYARFLAVLFFFLDPSTETRLHRVVIPQKAYGFTVEPRNRESVPSKCSQNKGSLDVVEPTIVLLHSSVVKYISRLLFSTAAQQAQWELGTALGVT